MKLNLRRQLSSTYDRVVLSKMSISDGLVSNIVFPTRLFSMVVDSLLPSTILICDSFLCCCDELWPLLVAIFFVVLIDLQGATSSKPYENKSKPKYHFKKYSLSFYLYTFKKNVRNEIKFQNIFITSFFWVDDVSPSKILFW